MGYSPWGHKRGGCDERLNDNEQPPGLSLLAAVLMKHHGPWGGFPLGAGKPCLTFLRDCFLQAFSCSSSHQPRLCR